MAQCSQWMWNPQQKLSNNILKCGLCPPSVLFANPYWVRLTELLHQPTRPCILPILLFVHWLVSLFVGRNTQKLLNTFAQNLGQIQEQVFGHFHVFPDGILVYLDYIEETVSMSVCNLVWIHVTIWMKGFKCGFISGRLGLGRDTCLNESQSILICERLLN